MLDWDLQRQLAPHMKHLVPRPGIYDPNFIAANQVWPGGVSLFAHSASVHVHLLPGPVPSVCSQCTCTHFTRPPNQVWPGVCLRIVHWHTFHQRALFDTGPSYQSWPGV